MPFVYFVLFVVWTRLAKGSALLPCAMRWEATLTI
jgi:hypothetical protein